ncbi:hypothetical protein HanIR_Chr12g0569071 [Helianthus annuus]|nr:hypothetical protein HanIR_Chr12g0569071 [Helianthus annuus]
MMTICFAVKRTDDDDDNMDADSETRTGGQLQGPADLAIIQRVSVWESRSVSRSGGFTPRLELVREPGSNFGFDSREFGSLGLRVSRFKFGSWSDGSVRFDSVKPSQLSQQMCSGRLVSSLFGSIDLVRRSGFVILYNLILRDNELEAV